MKLKNIVVFIFVFSATILIYSCTKQTAPTVVVNPTDKNPEKQLTLMGPKIAVGESYCGGIIFYVDSTGKHGLITPPRQVLYSKWGCTGQHIGNTGSAIGTGKSNTKTIIESCSSPNCAARVCDSLVLNGYDDWFLPSKDELDSLYARKELFKDFKTNYYWTSTEFDEKSAYCQDFYDGHKLHYGKMNVYYIRPVREF